MEAAILIDSLQFGETKIINAHFPPKEKGCFLSYLTGFLVQPLKYPPS